MRRRPPAPARRLGAVLLWTFLGGLAGPADRSAATASPLDPAFVTSAPFKVEIEAEVDGEPVSLSGDFAGSSAGVCLRGPAGEAGVRALCSPPAGARPGRRVECRVEVLALAQFGTVPGPRPLEWLLRPAEEGAAGGGALATEWAGDGGLVYPARWTLELDPVLTLQRAGEAAVELRARERLRLAGRVHGWPPFTEEWPPRSVVLRLAGSPLPFYRTADLARAGARPAAVVRGMYAVLGTQPTEFFLHRPDLLAARPLRPEGARGRARGIELRWTPTRERVAVPPVAVYSVYRRTGGEGAPWQLAARVPADRASAVDSGFRGDAAVAYVVRHGTELPFGRLLEGLPGEPLTVPPEAPGAASE